LNPSYWCIKGTTNHQKHIRMEKVMAPQSRGGLEFLKNHWTPQRLSLEHQKNSSYVALLLLKFKDDLYNLRWHSYNTLNHLKWMRNKKVMRFESSWSKIKRRKKRKTHFINWNFFFLLLFFHYSFAFQIWFLELEVVLLWHFKSLKMKHILWTYK